MKDAIVLRVMAKLFIPIILMFGLYVQFHGDYGPGGGFQAGVVAAAAVILHTLVFGLRRTQRALPPAATLRLMAAGVLTYAGTGVFALLKGGNFLGYNALSDHPVEGQHLGILLVELGVGVAVFAAMVAIVFSLSTRGRS